MTKEADAWPGVDKAAIERELRAHEAQWKAQLDARDIEGLLSHAAPDTPTNFLNPQSGLTTREASRKALEEALKDPNFDSTFTTHYFGIADSGEWAYCRGNYQNWGTDPKTQQKVVVSKGSYINVWKKDAAGNWKTVEDLLAPDMSPQSTAGH